MPNNDIAWLTEPQTQAFFMQFPLPLAMVGRDGSVKQLNHQFNETMKSSFLASAQLQKLLQRAGGEFSEAISIRCEESATDLLVRAGASVMRTGGPRAALTLVELWRPRIAVSPANI